jgi:hypothetical protein
VTKAKPDLNEELRLEQQRVVAYRTTADRYRQLLAEATTPALAQHLREMIARCEALARESEASEYRGSIAGWRRS